MHNNPFIELLYSEAFIINLDNNKIKDDVSVKIYGEFFDVVEKLSSIGNKNTEVMHGHLLPATVIPNKFNGVSVFIIVNLSDKGYNFVVESNSNTPENLAIDIEAVVSNGWHLAPREINIEDVFLLYGTKIKTVLSIVEDELDEEFIERSGAVADEVHDIVQELNSKQENNRWQI